MDDCFDPFSDGTSGEDKEVLDALARQGRGLGFHLLLAGSSEDLSGHSWESPIKTLKAAQVGFMLGVSDDSIFNLRLPYSERDQVLSPGEAYWTSRGGSHKVKIATPHGGNMDSTSWSKLLANRHVAAVNDEAKQGPAQDASIAGA